MSTMTMESVVKGVEPRKATIQGQERTIYDIVDETGTKWTAFERELAERAWELKDKPSVWKVEQKPNPRNANYPYRNLKDIAAKVGNAMGEALGGGSGFPESAQENKSQAFDAGMKASSDSTSEAIHRQTAAKCVSWMAASQGMTPSEFWSNVQDLTNYFNTGAAPGHGMGGVQPQNDSFPPADDDIPF